MVTTMALVAPTSMSVPKAAYAREMVHPPSGSALSPPKKAASFGTWNSCVSVTFLKV